MNLNIRPTQEQYFIQMARLVSSRATCLRRAVGCVLVNNLGHVIATGYNGVARGLEHCNEPCNMADGSTIYLNACGGAYSKSGTNLDSCNALHAEWNALLQCKDTESIEVAYVTTQPCITCTKMFLNTSCKRIIFAEPYPHQEAELLWLNSGRELFRFNELNNELISLNINNLDKL